jgi:PHP family Zn ribbon phosphoesterase
MTGTCWKCRERGEHWDAATEDGRCYVCHVRLDKTIEDKLDDLLGRQTPEEYRKGFK